jgi:hypothetical protein
MREQIMNDVLTCTICQTQKKQLKKYGLLPEKDAEAMPWEQQTMCQSHWSIQYQKQYKRS